jgi:hypothetical protein
MVLSSMLLELVECWSPAGRSSSRRHGVKAHHVFQVIRVVDRDHVLAISGNDHNDVRTRIRPTSDVIGWREVTDESAAAGKPAADSANTDKPAADKVSSGKSSDDASAQVP